MSIYQTDEWKEAMIAGGYKPVDIFGSDKVVAFENTVKAFFGKRKIIVARGISNHEHLRAFLNISKKYFYGTIAAKVTDYNDDIFKKIGFRRVDDYTILIDLSKTEEELWHNLEKKSARWGAKTAEKNTLVFEEIKDVLDLKDFYSLYKDTAASGGFSGKNFEFLYYLFKHTNIAKMFMIKNGKKIIAGGVLLIDKDYTILDITASNEEGYKLQAMPFLYWKLILFSKNQGKKYFDLGGYSKEARAGEKTYKINKFKEEFGGGVVEQPIYTTNWKYPFLRNLMRKFRIIKKFYTKK